MVTSKMADDDEFEVCDATEITDSSHDLVQEIPSNASGVEAVCSEVAESVRSLSVCEETTSPDVVSHEEETNSYIEELISNGLSQLGRSADGTMQVFLTVDLSNKNLTDIWQLNRFEHLQTVILAHNNISDLTALQNMQHLVKLDVSHNNIQTILDFKPPRNLLDVDLSNNLIEELTGLSNHEHLVKIVLDYNNIEEIKEISRCERLKYLSISHNRIQRITCLENLPLTYVNLSYNNIKKIENMETLKYLQVLDLSGNNIRSLKGLQNHEFLQEINLEGNQMIDIAEIRYIRELRLLRNLNLLSNPVQDMPDYKLSILFRLQMLAVLDKNDITPCEKIHAINMFNPPRDVIAARDHMVHVVRSLVQPARVFDSTLTSVSTPYPMLILTGPCGSGKRFLTKKLCQEFPDYFGLGVSTTTRPRRKKEESGRDYFFTSQEDFEHDVMQGKFLQTVQRDGYWYGITREAIESVARKGQACTLHMELEGILSLRNTYLEPRYVLVLPETRQEHERRLRENSYYSEAVIKQALDRVELYASTNREKPGFFEMTIMHDDLNECYKKLKALVLEYLGMSPTSTTESEFVLACSYTDMSHGSRDSENILSNGSTITTTISRSRPRSENSNNVINTSLDSSKVLTPTERESLERRRVLAKAALAGIPYVSKEQLHELRSRGVDSATYNFQRSVSAPTGNSYLSMMANFSNLTSNPLDGTHNGSEFDSDSESRASSLTPSSAKAYHIDNGNLSRNGSMDSQQYSLVESLASYEGSLQSNVREESLGNSI